MWYANMMTRTTYLSCHFFIIEGRNCFYMSCWIQTKSWPEVKEAIDDGCEVMGYTWWGPIDIVSAGTGEMRKRYGFIYVDRDNEGKGTLERKKKESFYRYKEIINSKGSLLF